MPCILTPIARIIDILRSDAESPTEFFRQHLYPFNLAIGRAGGFAVRYHANANGLRATEPVLVRCGRQLSLPLYRRLYVPVGAFFAVAYTEMEIYISGLSEALIWSQLPDVAWICAAIINLDAVPAIGGWNSLRTDSIFNRIETTIGPEGKRAGRRWIMPRSHQECGSYRHWSQ